MSVPQHDQLPLHPHFFSIWRGFMHFSASLCMHVHQYWNNQWWVTTLIRYYTNDWLRHVIVSLCVCVVPTKGRRWTYWTHLCTHSGALSTGTCDVPVYINELKCSNIITFLQIGSVFVLGQYLFTWGALVDGVPNRFTTKPRSLPKLTTCPHAVCTEERVNMNSLKH